MVYIGCQMLDPRCTKVHFSWTGTKIVLLHTLIGVTFPPFQSFLTKSSNLEPGGQLHVQQFVKVANSECQKGKAGLQSLEKESWFDGRILIWWQACEGVKGLTHFYILYKKPIVLLLGKLRHWENYIGPLQHCNLMCIFMSSGIGNPAANSLL